MKDFQDLNTAIVAASSDPRDDAEKMADHLGIPVGYGVDQATIESIGGYWEANRKFAQPAEFILRPDNTVALLSYSDGPLSRMEAGDAVRMITNYRKK